MSAAMTAGNVTCGSLQGRTSQSDVGPLELTNRGVDTAVQPSMFSGGSLSQHLTGIIFSPDIQTSVWSISRGSSPGRSSQEQPGPLLLEEAYPASCDEPSNYQECSKLSARSDPDEPGSIPGGVAPRFPLMRIVLDDASGWSKDLPFPPSLRSGAATYSTTPSSALHDPDAKSRLNLSTPLSSDGTLDTRNSVAFIAPTLCFRRGEYLQLERRWAGAMKAPYYRVSTGQTMTGDPRRSRWKKGGGGGVARYRFPRGASRATTCHRTKQLSPAQPPLIQSSRQRPPSPCRRRASNTTVCHVRKQLTMISVCSYSAHWSPWNAGNGGALASAPASHLGDPGPIPGGFAPGFSHVGIVLDDAARRRVFSGYTRFPRPCIPAPLHPKVSFHVVQRRRTPTGLSWKAQNYWGSDISSSVSSKNADDNVTATPPYNSVKITRRNNTSTTLHLLYTPPGRLSTNDELARKTRSETSDTCSGVTFEQQPVEQLTKNRVPQEGLWISPMRLSRATTTFENVPLPHPFLCDENTAGLFRTLRLAVMVHLMHVAVSSLSLPRFSAPDAEPKLTHLSVKEAHCGNIACLLMAPLHRQVGQCPVTAPQVPPPPPVIGCGFAVGLSGCDADIGQQHATSRLTIVWSTPVDAGDCSMLSAGLLSTAMRSEGNAGRVLTISEERRSRAYSLGAENQFIPDVITIYLIVKEWVVGDGEGGGVAVSLLAFHQGDPGSIPGRVNPDFRMWESFGMMPLVGGFSRGSLISPAPSLRRCSILTSITLIGSQDLDVKSHANHYPFTRPSDKRRLHPPLQWKAIGRTAAGQCQADVARWLNIRSRVILDGFASGENLEHYFGPQTSWNETNAEVNK
ncbi:hypothetical protein PR048_001644 [Dryococelus australis]|uniref:Uncharacterized protein n=1 Tax=Dryococelus australis TaxID=614101 RepID=A0ABQ9IHX6_9NEOP|nr:hypothetical protein PR048_001644 [Dryococelus australis]